MTNNKVIWLMWIWVSGYSMAILFPQLKEPLYIFGLLAIIMGVLWFLKLPVKSLFTMLMLLIIAFAYYLWFDHRNVSHINESFNDAAVEINGRITSDVVVDGDHVGFVLMIAHLQLIDDSTKHGVEPLEINESVQVSLRLLTQVEQAAALTWQRGDGIQLSGKLQLPSSARNFGGFDYRQYLKHQHIHWMFIVKGLDSVAVDSSFHWNLLQLLRYNDQFRGFLAAKLDLLFPESQAGYMKSLLIGLRADLDPQQFQQFSNLGLTHILAISGMQVAVFCAVVLWILRKLRFTKETGLLITITLLPFYVMFTGSSPSVVRAGLMGMIALYAARRNWLKDGLKLLCLVGWLMLIWNPYALLDVSFQLSFAVTYGLIVGVPWISQLLPQQKTVNSTLAVTLVAQMVSFPLTIYYFNQFSLISWLANIILVPFISFVVTPIGSIALILSFVYSPFAQGIAWLAIKSNQFTFWLTAGMDSWNGFHMIWKSPSIIWIILYYGFIAGTIWCLVRWKAARHAQLEGVYIRFILHSRGISLSVLCHLIGLIMLLWFGYNPEIWNNQGLVQFIDVGQGDAILIRTPSNKLILVDGGGTLVFHKQGDEWKQRKTPFEVGKNTLVPLLKKRGVQQLDYIIVSHEHTDHIGGLQEVLEQIPVRHLIFNGTVNPNSGVIKLFRSALQLNIPLIVADESLVLSVDNHTALRFLYPFKTDEKEINLKIEKNQNDQSIVFLLEMYTFHFLFTGDMEKISENKVLEHLKASQNLQQQQQPPLINVLKMAHHGSKTSTTEAWLDYWQPKQAVISVGEHNLYGHPSKEVLVRLNQHEIDLFRTDKQGEVDMFIKEDGIQSNVKFPN